MSRKPSSPWRVPGFSPSPYPSGLASSTGVIRSMLALATSTALKAMVAAAIVADTTTVAVWAVTKLAKEAWERGATMTTRISPTSGHTAIRSVWRVTIHRSLRSARVRSAWTSAHRWNARDSAP